MNKCKYRHKMTMYVNVKTRRWCARRWKGSNIGEKCQSCTQKVWLWNGHAVTVPQPGTTFRRKVMLCMVLIMFKIDWGIWLPKELCNKEFWGKFKQETHRLLLPTSSVSAAQFHERRVIRVSEQTRSLLSNPRYALLRFEAYNQSFSKFGHRRRGQSFVQL